MTGSSSILCIIFKMASNIIIIEFKWKFVQY